MQTEQTENRYEIRTMQDIADAITIENADRFLKDFHNFIGSVLVAKATNQMLVETGKATPEQVDMKVLGYTWIDDGKDECIAKITYKDSDKVDRVDFGSAFKHNDDSDDGNQGM